MTQKISHFSKFSKILCYKIEIISTFKTFCPFRFSLNFDKLLLIMLVTSTQKFPVQLQFLGFQNEPYTPF